MTRETTIFFCDSERIAGQLQPPGWYWSSRHDDEPGPTGEGPFQTEAQSFAAALRALRLTLADAPAAPREAGDVAAQPEGKRCQGVGYELCPGCADCDGLDEPLPQKLTVAGAVADFGHDDCSVCDAARAPAKTLRAVHDDDCGAVLRADGFCERCGFHPDAQSVAFVDPAAAQDVASVFEREVERLVSGDVLQRARELLARRDPSGKVPSVRLQLIRELANEVEKLRAREASSGGRVRFIVSESSPQVKVGALLSLGPDGYVRAADAEAAGLVAWADEPLRAGDVIEIESRVGCARRVRGAR